MFLTSRQEKLLNIIIDNYIKTAEPVSSKFLVKARLFDLSSATLRNEMNGLEQVGFLTQLHTSGGRVPTDRGYRFYVDNQVNRGNAELNGKHRIRIDKALKDAGDSPREINRTVAQLLSDLSENVVIAGIAEEDDFYKTGLASLFELPEFHELNKIFRLTSFFDDFDRMFDQIEKNFFSDFRRGESENEINVFIGRENRHPSIRDETVMTARYNLPNNLVGSLTMIGPMRMDYRRNIGLVRYTTNRLNELVKQV